jgi:hypothetical protein
VISSALLPPPGRSGRAPVGHDVLHHLLLLVDLDGKYAAELALVIRLGHRLVKTAVDGGDAGSQDVAEPQQHRHADAARLQAVQNIHHADGRVGTLAARAHRQLTFFGYIKISDAPIADSEEIRGLFARPPRERFWLHSIVVSFPALASGLLNAKLPNPNARCSEINQLDGNIFRVSAITSRDERLLARRGRARIRCGAGRAQIQALVYLSRGNSKRPAEPEVAPV